MLNRLCVSVFLVASMACSGRSTTTSPSPTPAPAPTPSVPVTSYVVSGTVFAGVVPVKNALVDLLVIGSHYTFTGPDGKFRIAGAPKGPFVLRAGKWGFKTQTISIVVDGDVSHDVTLQPAELPQPLAIGILVGSVVRLDDMICATSDPGIDGGDVGQGLVGPCKTFLVTIPQDGTLVATATWSGKDMYMQVVTPLHGRCCSSPLSLGFAVTAGSMVELGVSIHASDLLLLGAITPFELVTRLEPNSTSNR